MPRIFAGTGPRQLRAGEALQSPARSHPDPRAAACGEHGEDGEHGACAWGLWRGRRPLDVRHGLPCRLGASAPLILLCRSAGEIYSCPALSAAAGHGLPSGAGFAGACLSACLPRMRRQAGQCIPPCSCMHLTTPSRVRSGPVGCRWGAGFLPLWPRPRMRAGRSCTPPPCSCMHLTRCSLGLSSRLAGPEKISLMGFQGLAPCAGARGFLHPRAPCAPVSLMGISF